jgi:exodeoxyribonuclease VII small subunit
MAEPSDDAVPSAGPTAEKLSFEAALERLEAVVARLERGDQALEEALASFEEGVRLSKQCAAELERAERRIEVLVGQGDGAALRPFTAPEGE